MENKNRSRVISDRVFTPQEYCEEFLKGCKNCELYFGQSDSHSGCQTSQLREWLDQHCLGDIWDYPLDEIDYILFDTEDSRVVLVNLGTEYRWFEVPANYEWH